jgi:hypothetical protein
LSVPLPHERLEEFPQFFAGLRYFAKGILLAIVEGAKGSIDEESIEPRNDRQTIRNLRSGILDHGLFHRGQRDLVVSDVTVSRWAGAPEGAPGSVLLPSVRPGYRVMV